MATIRIGMRIFKAAVNQVHKLKQKITDTVTKACDKGKNLSQRFKKNLRSLFSFFSKKKHNKTAPILIHARPKLEKRIKQKRFKQQLKSKKYKRKKKQSAKQVVQNLEKPGSTEASNKKQSSANEQKEAPQVTPILSQTIENFYREWEANWGPALTSLDREFLETASPEVVHKVIANARLTLKSPYLKAVYNGLKDLQDIDDLLEKDELAKQHVRPLLADYWERGPEKFSEFLLCMHDKGVFPTRSGERRLNLDPRLVPEWLGLVS